MCLDVSAVDGRTFRDRTSVRQGFDQISPEPFVRPTVEAIIDCRVRSVVRRAIAPTASGLEDVDDARDDTPVIDTASTRLVPRKIRLNRRPLRIAQPE